MRHCFRRNPAKSGDWRRGNNDVGEQFSNKTSGRNRSNTMKQFRLADYVIEKQTPLPTSRARCRPSSDNIKGKLSIAVEIVLGYGNRPHSTLKAR